MRIYWRSVHTPDNENIKNRENRRVFLSKNNLEGTNLVLAGLVHGNKIMMVYEKDKGKVIPECDGFITNTRGVILGVTAADCLSVYFWNKKKTIVGIAHAGWRGVQKKIVEEMVKTFINKYGCATNDIFVEIAPHILDCHFEIQSDVAKKFAEHTDSLKEIKSGKYLSLEKIIKKQLISVGIENKYIQEARECTFCEKEKYFSYRRDKPEDIEAMLAYITLV